MPASPSNPALAAPRAEDGRSLVGKPGKERLLRLLAEAAADLDHNLLCSYLLAFFSLEQTERRPQRG